MTSRERRHRARREAKRLARWRDRWGDTLGKGAAKRAKQRKRRYVRNAQRDLYSEYLLDRLQAATWRHFYRPAIFDVSGEDSQTAVQVWSLRAGGAYLLHQELR